MMALKSELKSKKNGAFIAFLAVATTLGLTLGFFWIIPIEGTTLAMDWKGLWEGIKSGVILYGNQTGLRIPPWSLVIILPLGFLPFRLSWGVISLITIAALVVSVPKAPRHWWFFSIFVLVISFPSLRAIADGNFEALVIAGALLIAHGFSNKNVIYISAGILLVSTKIQESWILLLLMPVLLLTQLDRKKNSRVILLVTIVVLGSLIWKGREWIEGMFAIEQRGSIMDSSIWATSSRWGIPILATSMAAAGIFGATSAVTIRKRKKISNQMVGFLIAASLLLAPYAAGNSYLTVFALGVIPLFLTSPILGMTLIALANAPYLVIHERDILYWWGATYWTGLLLVTWIVLGYHLLRSSTGQKEHNPSFVVQSKLST